MVVTLYQYSGKSNQIVKNLGVGVNVDGLIKDVFNVVNPSITLRANSQINDFKRFNYCYVPILYRYYFVENLTVLSADKCIINLSVDVLQSYSTEIKAATATIIRRENANKFISIRQNIHDVRPSFEKIDFSVNAPFDENGNIIMVTLKGR